MRRVVAMLGLVAAATACSGEPPTMQQAVAETPQQVAAALPDQQAVRVADANGPSLQGWRGTPAPQAQEILRYGVHIEPENSAFAGARAFVATVREGDAEKAARLVAAAEGFESVRVLGTADVPAVVVERLEKGGRVKAVMLEGRIKGAPARFVGYVWYGALGEPDGKAASGVHGFVAPQAAFVALGGYAVPAILFTGATATPDTPMSVDGAKPPQQAVQELAEMWTGWANKIGSGDDLSTLNMIMNGNLGVRSGTGCINMPGCVGGGTVPVYTPPRY
jgi:hypothetical protein